MFEFARHLIDDAHPIINHFPIAMLVTSFVLACCKRKWNGVSQTEWLLFAWGAWLTLPASISGVAAHEPYENLPIHATIERHALPANVGTLVMVGVAIWRYRSRRKQADIGDKNWYLAFAVIGLIWIFIVGGTGGSLTYDYGINVRGVNPLP